MPKTRKHIPHPLRFDILTRCNYACYYCGVPASMGAVELHMEHVVPFSLGGSDEPWNLVAACWPCNIGKSNIVPPESLIRAVYDDWASFSCSRGLPVNQCEHCRIPMWTEPGDDPSNRCLACDEAVTEANYSGRNSGFEQGYKQAEEECVEAFATYIISQRKGGV